MRNFAVIGAGGNLGPIWCRALLESDAKVLGIGKGLSDDTNIEKIKSKFHSDFELYECDLTDNNAKSCLREHIAGKFFHGIVMNVGIDSTPGTGKSSLLNYSFEEWNSILSVNISALVDVMNMFVPLLTDESSVVILGSIYALVSPDTSFYSHYNDGNGAVKNPAYGASKGALLSLSRQYATHLAPLGIRVNVLTLGGFLGMQDRIFLEKINIRIPVGRLAQEEDVTGPLLFLLGEQSRYITGQNLIVDGGFVAL